MRAAIRRRCASASRASRARARASSAFARCWASASPLRVELSRAFSAAIAARSRSAVACTPCSPAWPEASGLGPTANRPREVRTASAGRRRERLVNAARDRTRLALEFLVLQGILHVPGLRYIVPPLMTGPRIPPGTAREIGRVNFAIARGIGLVTGGTPPHVFTTLARHRRLFRRWLRFAGALMPGGKLPRADTELVILRVAHNCDCEYEWRHHERLGKRAGLSADDIARVRDGAGAAGWTPRQELLLRTAD